MADHGFDANGSPVEPAPPDEQARDDVKRKICGSQSPSGKWVCGKDECHPGPCSPVGWTVQWWATECLAPLKAEVERLKKERQPAHFLEVERERDGLRKLLAESEAKVAALTKEVESCRVDVTLYNTLRSEHMRMTADLVEERRLRQTFETGWSLLVERFIQLAREDR